MKPIAQEDQLNRTDISNPLHRNNNNQDHLELLLPHNKEEEDTTAAHQVNLYRDKTHMLHMEDTKRINNIV